MRLESSITPTVNELSAETHLQLGIEMHESGSLQESTYHLRLAANAGLPTAMLLYALACRHGWGMKVNAEEGVAWLQKAVDSSQLEVAEDEDLIKSGQTLNLAERKSHKAQFALSVYELGVSYMNGWGVEQDRPLALRCFEIAGNWGDPDALAEAGYCYLEGVGCKKDTKRSASLYRRAEAKGITVAGNSWSAQVLSF
jgi:TPR repeat protein